MKRKYLKLSALILSVSALTVLSSCETSARYIGSNTWEGEVKEVYHDSSEWYALSQKDISTTETGTLWSVINSNTNNYTKFYLSEDITLSSADYAIWVESSITLCLNGHNINAYANAGTNETEGIISIKSGGSLTLEDCAATEHTGGKITGGNDVYNSDWTSGGSGGGISVSEGTLIMNGGIIEGNSAQYLGGGIYNYKGYVEINGGSIKNNTAGQEGGGIYNDNGTLIINGGEISGNSAVDGGGIYSNCDETENDQGLYINGGTITGNSAETDAGGVKFEHYVESEYEGETIYQESQSTLHLSGTPYIYDNYATQNNESVQYNIETDELSLLAFDGALTEGAKIGVTYSGKKAQVDPPYQISVYDSNNYAQSSVSYIVSDVEYYQAKYSDTSNYLVLEGVSGYNEVTTTSITLTFEFTYSSDVAPTSTSGNKIILPTTEEGEAYARIFIEGSWDDYKNEYNLTLDEENDSYYVTLTGLTINYHSFYIYVGYLDNDDHIPLSDDNPEFTFMVPLDIDSKADSGEYTIEFNIESENEFSELVNEEDDVHKVSFTLQFRLWQGYGSAELMAIDYGDLYVYSDMNDWSGWMKCYVDNDNRYCLDVDNLQENTYEYSLVIWYNDEEIPDPEEDSSVWDRKVNTGQYNDGVSNNIFTVTDEIIADNETNGYIPIDVDNTRGTLENLLPFRLKDYTFTFKFTSDENTVTTCPDYGSLYINGNFEQGTESWVQDYYKLTLNSDNETYSVTIPTLMPGEMEFNILFVYEGENPGDSWTHALFSDNETLTIDKDSGNYYTRAVETYNLGYSIEQQFGEHGALLTNYTLSFTIYATDCSMQGRDYSTYGYNVYIIGSFAASGYQTAYKCAWTNHANGDVSFDITTDEFFYAGESYQYKLLYVNTEVDSYVEGTEGANWSNPQITRDDQTLQIPADAESGQTLEISVTSDMWFNNPWRN